MVAVTIGLMHASDQPSVLIQWQVLGPETFSSVRLAGKKSLFDLGRHWTPSGYES
jgi:hypothetical protein